LILPDNSTYEGDFAYGRKNGNGILTTFVEEEKTEKYDGNNIFNLYYFII
jgi:hypothetical protein